MPDDQLVAQSLGGNRDAFGKIVSRYQSLICSLAYSATGSLGQSEDLAQETFITAWKHLRQLREKQKLRAWLCGIARNRINNEIASQFIKTNPFFKNMEILGRHIGWLNLLWLIPLVGWWRVLAKRART